MDTQLAEAPQLPGLPLIGHLPALRHDRIGLFMRASALGDVVQLGFGPRRMFLVRAPEHVKYVLQDNQKNFSKQTRGYAALRTVLGNGLVTSEGAFWLRQRRIAQPAFHRQRISRFGETMVRCTAEMLDGWEARARRGEPLDVAHEMMALTLRIVGLTLLSTEVSADAGTVERALDELLRQVIHRTTALVALPLSIPTPQNRRMKVALGSLDRVVLRLISERRQGGEDPGDLLSMLMHARDEETGESMSDVQLRDEVMTIFLAGHETTANALTWTLYLLSQHPEIESRVQAELEQSLGGRTPTVEDLPRLGYTLQVVQESMRLYPPVWLLVRHADRDDAIGGYRIPAGSFVAVSQYVSHRNPAVFEDPERFDPDRFTPERAAQIPRFAYYPFGGGPRICIGNSFALMEAQLVLATILQRYRLELVPGHPVVLEPTVTLRPRHGMRMYARPRAAPVAATSFQGTGP